MRDEPLGDGGGSVEAATLPASGDVGGGGEVLFRGLEDDEQAAASSGDERVRATPVTTPPEAAAEAETEAHDELARVICMAPTVDACFIG